MSTDELAKALTAVGKEVDPSYKDCQAEMTAAGGKFQVGLSMEPLVIQSGNIFTGKNPPSAAALATAVVYHYDKIKAEFEPPRLLMLKGRAELVTEIEAIDVAFNAGLAGAKDDADKMEALVASTTAKRDFYGAMLADLDVQLARNASMRQAAIDAAAAKAAAEAEE